MGGGVHQDTETLTLSAAQTHTGNVMELKNLNETSIKTQVTVVIKELEDGCSKIFTRY